MKYIDTFEINEITKNFGPRKLV